MNPLLLQDRASELFDYLPERIFSPLAAPRNKHRYWRLLFRMHVKWFGPDAPTPPTEGIFVRDFIQDLEEAISTQDDWEDEEGINRNTPISIRAHGVLGVFVEAGWLGYEQRGLARYVTMPPAPSRLLTMLVRVADAEPITLSGKVRAIESSLKTIHEGSGLGDQLVVTAGQVRELIEAVKNITVSIRDFMNVLSKENRLAAYIDSFGTNFIENIFIKEYRALRTKDHPLARRVQMLSLIEDLHTVKDHRQPLIAWYVEHRGRGDARLGEAFFERDILRLKDLDRIDEFLRQLDHEVSRANKRTFFFIDYHTRAPRHFDRLITKAIERVSLVPESLLQDIFPPGRLMAGNMLSEPQTRIPRPPPSSLREVVPSDEKIAALMLRKEANSARTITRTKLSAYVSSALQGRDSVESGDLPVSTVHDFRCYQVLLRMALASSVEGGLARMTELGLATGYTVTFTDDEHESLLLSGRAFTVRLKRKQLKDKAYG